MFVSMKFVGVTPDALAKLHKVVKSPECMTQLEGVEINKAVGGGDATTRQESYVEIQESKLSPEHETYSVTVKVALLLKSSRNVGRDGQRKATFNLFTPMRVFDSLLKAIEPALAQDKEYLLPADASSEEALAKAKLEDKQHEILDALRSKLSINTCPVNLFTYGDSSEPLLSKGVVLGSYQWHRIADNIRFIDLDDHPNTEFINVLREAREQVKALDEEIRE